MATKTDTQTPATQETPAPVAVATVATFESADSKIDRPKYVAAFAALTTALVMFVEGVTKAGEASRQGAFALLDLRESVRRADNDAPDWAGKTAAYEAALGDFLTRWAVANEYVGPDGAKHVITSDQVKAYRSKVSSYASDHQLLNRRMAEYEARTNSQAKADLATVQAAWNAPAGTALPAEVKANAKAQIAKQVGFKSGKAFANFDPDTNVATVSGRKPKPGTDSGTGEGENASEGTPSKAWIAVLRQIEKGEGGFLPVDVLADHLHHLLSAALLQLTGPVGGKVPPASALPAQGKGRKDAIETYGTIAGLAFAATGALDPANKTATKANIEPLLWSENAE